MEVHECFRSYFGSMRLRYQEGRDEDDPDFTVQYTQDLRGRGTDELVVQTVSVAEPFPGIHLVLSTFGCQIHGLLAARRSEVLELLNIANSEFDGISFSWNDDVQVLQLKSTDYVERGYSPQLAHALTSVPDLVFGKVARAAFDVADNNSTAAETYARHVVF